MEIRAYDELYVESAQNIVGHMFDFAINEVDIDADEYAGLFAFSPIAKGMEEGNPTYVAGKTGPEIVRLVLDKAGFVASIPADVMYIDRSPEYWGGWVLAYYQWFRNRSYSYILKGVPFSEILKMYPVFHEMDIMRFVETLDEKLNDFYPDIALKRYRLLRGISQKELAIRADVPIRQIQLFEQRQRDINKAHAITVFKLSKALGCDMKDLVEM